MTRYPYAKLLRRASWEQVCAALALLALLLSCFL